VVCVCGGGGDRGRGGHPVILEVLATMGWEDRVEGGGGEVG